MNKTKKKFITEGFEGCVVLKEWIPSPGGNTYNTVLGKITILQDVDMVGFKVSDRESNWLARVEGSFGSVNILGCQIRAIFQHSIRPEKLGQNCLVV